jgi:hypothetical protein
MTAEAEIVYSFVLGFCYPSPHFVAFIFTETILNFGNIKCVHDFAGQRKCLWFITDIDRVFWVNSINDRIGWRDGKAPDLHSDGD